MKDRKIVIGASVKIFFLLQVCNFFSCADLSSGPGGPGSKDEVKIGTQVWMTKNLEVTQYRDGSSISKISDNTQWQNASNGAYCSYENNDGNVSKYGRLYNKYAVNSGRNIAPEGWHIPSEAEWQTLIDNLGGSAAAVNDLKSANGFSALAGGFRDYAGMFQAQGEVAGFWSKGKAFRIDFNTGTISAISQHETSGYSIRLIKD